MTYYKYIRIEKKENCSIASNLLIPLSNNNIDHSDNVKIPCNIHFFCVILGNRYWCRLLWSGYGSLDPDDIFWILVLVCFFFHRTLQLRCIFAVKLYVYRHRFPCSMTIPLFIRMRFKMFYHIFSIRIVVNCCYLRMRL